MFSRSSFFFVLTTNALIIDHRRVRSSNPKQNLINLLISLYMECLSVGLWFSVGAVRVVSDSDREKKEERRTDWHTNHLASTNKDHDNYNKTGFPSHPSTQMLYVLPASHHSTPTNRLVSCLVFCVSCCFHGKQAKMQHKVLCFGFTKYVDCGM